MHSLTIFSQKKYLAKRSTYFHTLQGDSKRRTRGLQFPRAGMTIAARGVLRHRTAGLRLPYPSLDLIGLETEFHFLACKLEGIDAIGVVVIVRSGVGKKDVF